MTRRAMCCTIAAPIVRFMVRANRIVRTDPRTLQCVTENPRETLHRADQAAQRALGSCCCCVDENPKAISATQRTIDGVADVRSARNSEINHRRFFPTKVETR